MLLIDCYNLLHAPMPPCLAGLEENRLCRLLPRGPWHRQRMVVVCDGGPKPGLPVASPIPAVELLYAGKGCSADDLIQAMIQQHHTPRRVTLVTSDRELQKLARRRKSVVISSEDFVQILAALAANAAPGNLEDAEPPRGQSPLPPSAVEAWLQTFGLTPPPDPRKKK
jgi:uncharacterized protein